MQMAMARLNLAEEPETVVLKSDKEQLAEGAREHAAVQTTAIEVLHAETNFQFGRS